MLLRFVSKEINIIFLFLRRGGEFENEEGLMMSSKALYSTWDLDFQGPHGAEVTEALGRKLLICQRRLQGSLSFGRCHGGAAQGSNPTRGVTPASCSHQPAEEKKPPVEEGEATSRKPLAAASTFFSA